jgi:hypothetical protein
MDVLYKIIGVRSIGNRICLTLSHIQEGKEFNTTKILSNLGGFMENMKQEATSSRNPDQISITVDEYKKGGYNLGEVISITINNVEG